MTKKRKDEAEFTFTFAMRADISEFKAVKATVEKYVEAVRAKDHKICEPYFTKGASCYGLTEGVLTDGDLPWLWKVIDEAKVSDVTSHIDVLYVDGTIAIARLLEDGWEGYDFSDYLVLIKLGSDWKVIAKCWHTVRSKKDKA